MGRGKMLDKRCFVRVLKVQTHPADGLVYDYFAS